MLGTNSLVSILWLGGIALLISFHIQRWYIKEYRFDRMFLFLKERLFLHMLLPIPRRMRLSLRTLATLMVSVVMCLGFYYYFPLSLYPKLLLLSLLTFPLTTVAVIFMKIPMVIYHRILIRRAKQKLKHHKNLIIIGVTGSYGKSSTKDLIAALLSRKYSVLATEGSKNTDIGAAELILKELKPTHQVLVLEMGAYKRGEIRAICKIAPPQIGVVTGLNEQHLELFGSLENTRKAKYELIQSLPKNGLAVCNGDNEYTRLMAKQTRHCRVIVYGAHKSAQAKIIETHQSLTHLSFTLQYEGKQTLIKTPFLGAHFAQNVTAAIVVARELKVPMKEITDALIQMTIGTQSFKKRGTLNGATVIDSSFNANPAAVSAAVSYMSLFAGRKCLILMPLIELGVQSRRIHTHLGQLLAEASIEVYVTNNNNFSDLKVGMEKAHKPYVLKKISPTTLRSLKEQCTSKDVVVFLGKETASLLRSLKLS